jgi:hypothetical protein
LWISHAKIPSSAFTLIFKKGKTNLKRSWSSSTACRRFAQILSLYPVVIEVFSAVYFNYFVKY